MMIDPFERAITYVRVSVTDRCDFRCVYCMAENMTFLPKKELLSLEELDRLCSAFVDLGVRKIRLTGGEPLVRRNIMSLFASLGRHLRSGRLEELTLTTNGSQLDRHAAELYEHGVRRVNVSLDTLDPARFQAITRWGKYDRVMAGIAAAKQAGLHVKINMVALKGVNDDEFDRMIAWCGAEGLRSDADRDHAARRYRRRPHRAVSAAVAGARPPRAQLDADRSAGPHRRAGALRTGRGDRRPDRLHHADDPQFLRILQPRAGHLHRSDVHVPGPGGRGRPLPAAARFGGGRAAQGRRSSRASARKPKGHDFVIDRRHNKPAVKRHMSVTGG